MKTKRVALSTAAVGTAAGVVGLVLVALPAGASAAPPNLPTVSPEALVQSVLSAEVPAMSGSVTFDAKLGLPIPGLPSTDKPIRVFTDGTGKAKVLLPTGRSEKSIVEDGTNVWVWDSADQSVVKIDPGADKSLHGRIPEGMLADPQNAAAGLVSEMRKDSNVTVDGTGWVADRSVYELVLTPKPTERTVLREVRVAVDSQLRVPLQLEVFANGQSDPAVKIGFTDFKPGAQDPKLFAFTPPPGATVTERSADDLPKPEEAKNMFDQLQLKVVGHGWDTVLTGKVPAGLLGATPAEGDKSQGFNPMQLIKSLGTPVEGAFGKGVAIKASVGTILITDDGRVAVGAVPEQVLAEALSK
jgi:outer membrane lipoprotein-sorting protein